jgi:predicted PurR-regulated permease PerM
MAARAHKLSRPPEATGAGAETNEQQAKGQVISNSPEGQFTRRVLTVVGVVLTVGLLVTVVWLSLHVWLAVFAGVLLAVFLRTLSDWVGRATHLSRGWSLAAVLLLLTGLMTLGILLVVPRMAEQFDALGERLPKAVEQAQSWGTQLGLDRYLPRDTPPASELAANAGKVLARVAGWFTVSVRAVGNFFVILFLGIYLAASPQIYIAGATHLFPFSKRKRVREVVDKLGDTLGHWLLGQMISMAVIGTLIGVGLTILGVPMGLALGVLAGLLNFVPIIGALLSALPAVLLAFLVSPLHPLYVIGLYMLVNAGIESHLLMPLIQRFAIDLPPALAVVALLLMGELFGFLGVLLAIPLTATILVLVKMLYIKDVLGDDTVRETETG